MEKPYTITIAELNVETEDFEKSIERCINKVEELIKLMEKLDKLSEDYDVISDEVCKRIVSAIKNNQSA